MADSEPAAAARERLLTEHGETLEAVLDAADAVATGDPEGAGSATGEGNAEPRSAGSSAAGWHRLDDGRLATPDRDALVPVFRAVLDDREVLGELPNLLAVAVDAAGYELPAAPVPAPPYVAMTSTGPVLRATVTDGRLVVNVDCFEVVRGGEAKAENVEGSEKTGVVYARTAREPTAALSVSFTATN